MELSQRFKQLEENVGILRLLKKEVDCDRFVTDRRLEWELRYGLLESIQILIDISCKVVHHRNLGVPKNYRECLELLGSYGYLERALADRCRRMVGLRNLLVHEYGRIETRKLCETLDRLGDFEAFVLQTRAAME